MVLLWLGLGAIIGVLSMPADSGPIGILAGAVAGMIVLPGVGGLFGILGGPWQESLLGAACGLVFGIIVEVFRGSTQFAADPSLYLLIGAAGGATLPQVCRLYLRLGRRLSDSLRSWTAQPGGSGFSPVSPEDGISP
jgi:hypothetical protein